MKPLLFLSAILYSTCVLAQHTDTILGKTTTTTKGDIVKMSSSLQKIKLVGKREVRFETKTSKPLLLNGQKIYYSSDDRAEADLVYETQSSKNSATEYQTLHTKIDSAIADIKPYLPTGSFTYELNNLIIDTNGSVAYYETDSTRWTKPDSDLQINFALLNDTRRLGIKMNKIISQTIASMRYTPFIWHGKPTPFSSHFKYEMTIPIR